MKFKALEAISVFCVMALLSLGLITGEIAPVVMAVYFAIILGFLSYYRRSGEKNRSELEKQLAVSNLFWSEVKRQQLELADEIQGPCADCGHPMSEHWNWDQIQWEPCTHTEEIAGVQVRACPCKAFAKIGA